MTARRPPALAALVITLVTVAMACACTPARHPGGRGTGAPMPLVTAPSGSPSASPGDSSRIGDVGSFAVGQHWMVLTEPAHAGPTGTNLGPRRLLTQVLYPLASRHAAAARNRRPAAGPLPMLVFGPGFMQCGAPYSRMLRSWASAGYVVAVVNFPEADCKVGSAATESDMVNEPGDMSYVIKRMLALSEAHRGLFAGLVDPHEIGITGQSDGGDVVAAIAANTCCSDHRVAAVAVLSGAEWPQMPGSYFSRRPVPMLFTQGSADTINPPGCSVVMYRADRARERYYLDLFGASHTEPYWGTNRYERIVVRVTVAFFNRYVLGQHRGGPAMRRFGSVPHVAALFRAGHGQFPSTYCNT